MSTEFAILAIILLFLGAIALRFIIAGFWMLISRILEVLWDHKKYVFIGIGILILIGALA